MAFSLALAFTRSAHYHTPHDQSRNRSLLFPLLASNCLVLIGTESVLHNETDGVCRCSFPLLQHFNSRCASILEFRIRQHFRMKSVTKKKKKDVVMQDIRCFFTLEITHFGKKLDIKRKEVQICNFSLYHIWRILVLICSRVSEPEESKR